VRLVPLGQVAEVNPRLPRDAGISAADEVAFLPMDAVSEAGSVAYQQRRRMDEVTNGYTSFRRGDILLAKITPCMENGKAAYLDALETEYGFGSTEFHVLRPSQDLDGRYAFYLIWNPRFRHLAECRMTGSAGQKRVPASFLKELEIPLPPPAEQRRIAAILDKADAIRRKHEQALACIEEAIQSTFIHVVGPRAPGYGVWREKSFDFLVAPGSAAMRTGPFGSDLLHSEFVDSGVAVLGIDNAVQNKFAWAERRYITEAKYDKLKRYTVHPGDVIVTIMGTTGRSAVIPQDIPLAITTKHLATITLDRRKAEPEVISNALHRHPYILRQIAKENKGAIMAGLNLGIIKALRIPLPPIEVQRQFVTELERLRCLERKVVDAQRTADVLFGSLSQRAFRGEL